jgi:hypothetical protein
MAQASTGIGKTLGTLFPLLKAMVPQQLDKLFFLTAKTPGRALALDAIRQITDATPQPALRTLELIARDKACEYPDKACHGESCPLAAGFYDRLPAAREAAHSRCSTAPTCAKWRWHTRYARTTWARRWRAGPTCWLPTTTTTSTRMPCCLG